MALECIVFLYTVSVFRLEGIPLGRALENKESFHCRTQRERDVSPQIHNNTIEWHFHNINYTVVQKLTNINQIKFL